MKQLWFVNNTEAKLRDRIAVRDVDLPEPGEDEVRVKIAYTALCATDVHQVTMGVLGATPPSPMGHESSGVIEALGPGAERYGFKTGDKVSLSPVSSCGLCGPCKRGQRQYCENAKPTGSFAEYVVTHVSAVFPIPDDADLRLYALAEPASCTIRAMDLAPIRHGASVTVSGVGGIGSILLNQVLLSGASKVTAIDPVPQFPGEEAQLPLPGPRMEIPLHAETFPEGCLRRFFPRLAFCPVPDEFYNVSHKSPHLP
jgi:(R,R)-butanediol dehydrogenase/meso-butanediol dehydrogenase/diacetyl reductase